MKQLSYLGPRKIARPSFWNNVVLCGCLRWLAYIGNGGKIWNNVKTLWNEEFSEKQDHFSRGSIPFFSWFCTAELWKTSIRLMLFCNRWAIHINPKWPPTLSCILKFYRLAHVHIHVGHRVQIFVYELEICYGIV